jgi:hypothetical protein
MTESEVLALCNEALELDKQERVHLGEHRGAEAVYEHMAPFFVKHGPLFARALKAALESHPINETVDAILSVYAERAQE